MTQPLFTPTPRTPRRIATDDLVSFEPLGERGFPLLVRSRLEDIRLASWIEAHRSRILTLVHQHGAVLFRGFGVSSEAEFEAVVKGASSELLEYTERSSPRTRLAGRVYSSTDYTADLPIFLHNEQSYNQRFPLKIFFGSLQCAERGGETPIADSRRIYRRIPEAMRQAFEARGYLYVRNFGADAGLRWQEAFQTQSAADVERYCRENAIDYEWLGGERLRTRQRRRVAARHPHTGEMSWFNHLTFFHVSTLPEMVRAAMLGSFAEADLPNQTYYGDGGAIEPDVLDTLRAAYEAEKVTFPWERGDVLMMDNMLAAHARNAYAGSRKVVVGMAEPCRWTDV
jgi:alpha-ketoglutarate-dependent taurine dioxygenase